jgi:hypothetical protein
MFGITKDLYSKKDMKLVFSRIISRGEILCYSRWFQGTDPGFHVRGAHLEKIAWSRVRRENFWGILCEKSRFYAKKSYFFPILMADIWKILKTQNCSSNGDLSLCQILCLYHYPFRSYQH